MSKYIFLSFLKNGRENIFDIDILMIPLQVNENDVLMLLIYICSYMYNLLERFSVSEWIIDWTSSCPDNKLRKIDSEKEDYKDSLPNYLARIQMVERVETSIIDSIVFFSLQFMLRNLLLFLFFTEM